MWISYEYYYELVPYWHLSPICGECFLQHPTLCKIGPPTAPDWFESISGVLDPFGGLWMAPKPIVLLWVYRVRRILGHISTFPELPFQPSEIFMVQHGLNRGPTYRTYVHLLGVFRPSRVSFSAILAVWGNFLIRHFRILAFFQNPLSTQFWYSRFWFYTFSCIQINQDHPRHFFCVSLQALVTTIITTDGYIKSF